MKLMPLPTQWHKALKCVLTFKDDFRKNIKNFFLHKMVVITYLLEND